MDAPEQFWHDVRDELSLYPTWLPFDRIELGAFGTIKRGKFHPQGSLADLSIRLVPEEIVTDAPLKKSRGVRFGSALATEASAAIVDFSLGVDVHFEREHSWVLAATGVSTVQIKNIADVRRGILDAKKRGEWTGEWLLVTELRKASVLNVLIAKSRNVSGRIFAKGRLSIADVLLGQDASFEFKTDDVFAVENHRHSTPLYAVRKLQGFLNKKLMPVSGGSAAPLEPEPDLEVADAEPYGYDD